MNDLDSTVLTSLPRLLATYFDLQELRTLCLDLTVRYDDLNGEGISNKARELVMLLARQKCLPELVTLGRKYRPNVDWPTIPADFDLTAVYSPPPTDTTQNQTAQTFNFFGVVDADFMHVGSTVTYNKPINVDNSQTSIYQPESEVVVGDKTEFSGDFKGATVNNKSYFESVTQTIQQLPHGDDTQKSELVELIKYLFEQLAQAPADSNIDSEKVFKAIYALIREMDGQNPDKEMVANWGKSLQTALSGLKVILPDVLTIATQIVNHALKLIG